jgi:hypothetical protein
LPSQQQPPPKTFGDFASRAFRLESANLQFAILILQFAISDASLYVRRVLCGEFRDYSWRTSRQHA